MLDTVADVSDDLRQLRLAVGAGAVGEHAHRHVISADAVDAAGELEFRAEGRLHETLDDFRVGEMLLFRALARGDRRNFRGCGLWPQRCRHRDRDRGEHDPQKPRVEKVHHAATLPQPAIARKARWQLAVCA
jgi:hypothetical protein